MAITSHFFLGTLSEAESNEATEDRAEFYRVMDTNIKPIYQLISAEKCPSFELVGNNEDYTVITQRVPIEFTTLLRDINDQAFEDVLQKWMAHEEAPYDNEKDHRDLLRSLVDLSKRVEIPTRQLYLWNAR